MRYKENRKGKVNKANNGQKMTIINYRGTHDIDVQFEDGSVVRHKDYRSFLLGEIKNPFVRKQCPKRKKLERIGEKRKANNGLFMEIIDYHNRTDIDIRFENGIILNNRNYDAFLKGAIACPGIKSPRNKISSNSAA